MLQMIQRSGEVTPSTACAAAVVAPIATSVATKDAPASLKLTPVDAVYQDTRARAPSTTSRRAPAPVPVRPRTRYPAPLSAAVAPVEADLERREATGASKRTPLDGDLIRRRWRSLIGRHPPKSLSHSLMERVLAWREQVAEGGDITPCSRAILAAALAGGKVGADGRFQGNKINGDHGTRSARLSAAPRVGVVLIREHAGVLQRVTVVAEGFEWEGRIYASLSAVARAIAGVRWNERRFFALDRDARPPVARKVCEQGANARSASHEPRESSRAGGGR